MNNEENEEPTEVNRLIDVEMGHADITADVTFTMVDASFDHEFGTEHRTETQWEIGNIESVIEWDQNYENPTQRKFETLPKEEQNEILEAIQADLEKHYN